MKTNFISPRLFSKPSIIKIIILLVSISQLQLAQWIQNTGIEGGDIRSIVYDGSKIYAGTSGGGIYVSDDLGLSWSRSINGLNYFFVSSMLIKEQYIYAGFVSLGIFASSDQGQNWFAVNNGLPNSTVTAMAELDTFIFAGMYNQVYASTNFGKSWFWRSSGLSNYSISAIITKDSMLLLGTSNGFYCSFDYGANWIERSNGLGNLWIKDLTVLDDKIFAATDFGGVYVTYDLGLQWLPAGLSYINVLSITSADTLLFAGTFSSGIFMSSDFGNNWFNFSNNYPYGSLTNELQYIDNTIFAGNEHGVYKLQIGETEWQKRTSGLFAHNSDCIVTNEDKIYVGTPGGKIYFSDDNGSSWDFYQVSETFAPILDIAFKGDTMYAVTNGYLYYSTNSGASWVTANLYSVQLSSIIIVDNKIFVGTSGFDGIWLSTNGGLTWTQKNNGLSTIHVNRLAFDDLNIYAGTQSGLFISSDFGDNWVMATSGISQTMYVGAIRVIGERIYVGGIYGIYLSTNKGVTWSFKGLPNRIVLCISGYENMIFAGTIPDGVYRSSNGGNSWQAYNDGLIHKHAMSIGIVDTTLLTGILGFGLWNRPLIITEVEKDENYFPTDFLLSQNFPNPFNPSTSFEYRIPEWSFVSIKIYDVLGKELRTLVDEEKSAGIYKINFDAEDLPSGVYFYRIQAGSFIDTKKMLLLR
jgi:photosystem II stability/assembly factor-like uncharacterized protein